MKLKSNLLHRANRHGPTEVGILAESNLTARPETAPPREIGNGGAFCRKLELSSTKIHREQVSPHLSPQRGYPLICNRPVFIVVLSGFGSLAAPPTSVGFMARAALSWWMPRSPKTSLIAHANTSSPPDGFDEFGTVKDNMSLTGETSLGTSSAVADL